MQECNHNMKNYQLATLKNKSSVLVLQPQYNYLFSQITEFHFG